MANYKRAWRVWYDLRDDKQGLGRADGCVSCTIGPFTNYEQAEKTLANLALNPHFRGGRIEETDRTR